MLKANILVVENDGIIAKDIAKRLKRMGFAVSSVAQSGEEAIIKAEEDRPNLILMDIKLQKNKMDGIEAACKLYSRFSSILIIFLTGYPVETIQEKAKAKIKGPFECITKPFKEKEFYRAYNKLKGFYIEETTFFLTTLLSNLKLKWCDLDNFDINEGKMIVNSLLSLCKGNESLDFFHRTEENISKDKIKNCNLIASVLSDYEWGGEAEAKMEEYLEKLKSSIEHFNKNECINLFNNLRELFVSISIGKKPSEL